MKHASAPSPNSLPPTVGINRAEFYLPLVIFLVAFALRMWHLLEARSSYPFFDHFIGDAASYNQWARRIAAGEWVGPNVFYQDPLYPYGIGFLFKLAGYRTFLVRVLQIVAGSMTCLMIYGTGRILFDRRAAFLAGLFAAAYGPFIFYEGTLLKEGLSVFLTSASLLAVVTASEKGTGRGWGLSGLSLGFLVLTRGNAFFLIPLIALWLVWRHRTEGTASVGKKAACLAVGVLIPLLPSFTHNYLAGRDWVLTTSQAGPNFYIGNHPGASGIYEPLVSGRQTPEYEALDAKSLAEHDARRPLKPSDVSRYWFARSWSFIARQPLDWLALLAKKAGLFLDGFEIPDVEDYYLVRKFSRVLRLPLLNYGLLCPLAVVGLFFGGPRIKKLAPLYVFAIGNAVSVVLFYVFARYRLPSIPPMMVLAGFTVVRFAEFLKQNAFRPFLLGLMGLGFLTYFVNRETATNRAAYLPTSYANLATYYQTKKQPEKAVEILREALAVSPADPHVRFVLGNNYFDMKKFDLAEREYETALRLDPNNTEALYLWGVIRYNRNDFAQAQETWRKVLAIHPSHDNAIRALAMLKERGFSERPITR